MNIFEQIRDILSLQLEVDPKRITMETTMDELGADSLDMVDLAMTVEDEFKLEFPEEVQEKIKTVGDVVNFLESR